MQEISNVLNEELLSLNTLEYTPPHNTEAEQAVIGSILNNNESWHEINGMISRDDFYNIQHQLIYDAILELFNKNRTIDSITLCEELSELNYLEKIGGRSYIIDIIHNTPSTLNIVQYAEIVRTKSVMRQLHTIGQKISQLAYNPAGKTAKDILDEAEQLVFNIAEQNQKRKSGFLSISEILNTVNEKLIKLYETPHQGITGIETGFYDLDKITSGLQSGDLIIIAGRPSMGKTAFAMNIAEHTAVKLSKPVAIFSMEMPADQLVNRMISSLAEIELSKIRTGNFEEQDWDKFGEIYTSLNQSKLFIDETGGLTTLDIKAKIRRLKRQFPDLSLVVIDYIQLMSGSGKSENRTTELGEISRALKILAKEISAPIIVLSQLSRNVENRNNKRPMMSDLRDSGAIEQDADLIIFMYRDSYYHNNELENNNIQTIDTTAEAIIGKHRNGATGTIKLTFFSQYTRFVNPNKEIYDDLSH